MHPFIFNKTITLPNIAFLKSDSYGAFNEYKVWRVLIKIVNIFRESKYHIDFTESPYTVEASVQHHTLLNPKFGLDLMRLI